MRPGSRLALVLVLLVGAVVSQATAAPTRTRVQVPPFIYGVNIAGVYTDAPRVMALTNAALVPHNTSGSRPWVRQQLAWQYTETADGQLVFDALDPVVQAAADHNLGVLLTVTKAPAWATANGGNGMPRRAYLAAFARFLQGVATHYQGRVQAYQIWNEQNYAGENGGWVESADYYVELLTVAYDALKAVDPRIIVVSGALTPTATNSADRALDDLQYYGQLFANPRFWDHTDVVGIHAGGTLNPPEVYAPQGPGPGWNDNSEFYFTRVEAVRQLMVTLGHADYPVWMTEFGWALNNVSPGFEYGDYNTPVEQATYIEQALARGRARYADWLGAMFVWNLNFAVTGGQPFASQDHMAAFSLLASDWTPRPAYRQLQAMVKP